MTDPVVRQGPLDSWVRCTAFAAMILFVAVSVAMLLWDAGAATPVAVLVGLVFGSLVTVGVRRS